MVQYADAVLYIAVGATLVWAFLFWKQKTKAKKNKMLKWGILVLLLWIILLIPSPKYVPSSEVIVQWDSVYANEMNKKNIPREYLVETEYYDFSDPTIQEAISEIKSKAKNYEQATVMALEYVYDKVPYNAFEADSTCFSATGSSVLESRTGQCDTQTIAVITLLRGMGIASRPVGGCIYKQTFCQVQQSMFSLFAQVSGVPYEPPKEPKFAPIQPGVEETGRRGGLHAWGEVWFPDDGWVTFESTTGELVRNSCYAYEVELYPANDDKRHLCVSTDRAFAAACAAK